MKSKICHVEYETLSFALFSFNKYHIQIIGLLLKMTLMTTFAVTETIWVKLFSNDMVTFLSAFKVIF